MKIGFVARSFSGIEDHLSSMIKQAIAYKGFSLVGREVDKVEIQKMMGGYK